VRRTGRFSLDAAVHHHDANHEQNAPYARTDQRFLPPFHAVPHGRSDSIWLVTLRRAYRDQRNRSSDYIFLACFLCCGVMRKSPYGEHFEFMEPRVPIALEAARPFESDDMRRRHPQETKGEEPRASSPGSQCCESGGCC